jgi:outer membrane protein insertion porin family
MPLMTTRSFAPGLKSVIHGYRIETVTLDATVLREFSLETSLAISGVYEHFDVYDVPDAEKEALLDEIDANINRKLIFELIRDSRPINSKFNPWHGSYTTYRLEYVGGLLGGDDHFVKLIFNWAKYNRVGRRSVFASRLRLGWVGEFGESKTVPSRDRFFIGGAFTVRGFRGNSVFPVDSLGAEGGETTALLNFELRSPLFWLFWGSLFFDSGFNAPSLDRISTNKFVYSFGAGLQFMSPVGPIRLDYGQRFPVNDIDPGGRIHLSILYAF